MKADAGHRSIPLDADAPQTPKMGYARMLNQVGATVTIVGSLVFLVGAFLPISFRVYPQPSAERKLESIQADPAQWLASQALFAVGAVVTASGIAVLAYAVRGEPSAWLVWLSVVLLAIAAIPWLWHVSARVAHPARFAQGLLPKWPSLVYFFGTEVALAVFGVALLVAPVPTWVGGIIVGSMGLFMVVTAIFRDMAPLAFYIVTLFAGVTLFIA